MKYRILTILDRLLYTYKIWHVVYTGDVPWINDINTPDKKETDPLWKGIPEEWSSLPKLFILGFSPTTAETLFNICDFDKDGFIFISDTNLPQVPYFIKTHPEYRGIQLHYGIILSKRADFKTAPGLTFMDLPEYRKITPGIDGEQLVALPDNWAPTVPVQGWFHIAAMGAGDYIAMELHGRLMQSGLYRTSDVIHVTLLGDQAQIDRMNELVFSKHQKYKIEHISNNVMEYEWATLKHMHKTAMESGDLHMWYIHTKGASNCRPNVPPQIQKNIRRWRDLMCHYTIGEYKKCQYLLGSGYDTVGSLLRYNTGCIAPYYVGNFWWATANYLRTLPEITEETISNRSNAEGWITHPKVKGKHFNQFWLETMDLYGFDPYYGDQGPFIGYEII